MRVVTAVAGALGFAAIGGGAVACFDLFHGTGNLATACEIDASTPGCTSDQATGVCASSAAEARRSAQHVCSWLGACESPMGRNAFGKCMFSALLAFDCTANPNHRAKGREATLWACLARAKACGEVDRCIFPAGPERCAQAGDYTSCGAAPPGGADNLDVRLECTDGGPGAATNARGENCALWGLTCAEGRCVPDRDGGCPAPGCYADTVIRWCSGGSDRGIDCAGSGAQRCDAFPLHDAGQWVACVPEGDSGSSCAPRATAACSAGVAQLCPAGVPESIGCASLLQTDGGCREGALDPPFDWTSACVVDPPSCDSDSCDGGVLSGCERGAVFSVDCAEAGLGACSMVSTDQGTALHAACSAR